MDKKKIISELQAVNGLEIKHFPLSSTYTLYTKVPYEGGTAVQVVGGLNLRRGEYMTNYPPNIDQFVTGDQTASTLAGLQREVIRVLEKNGMTYKGIDEKVLELGLDVIAGHSRDTRTTEEIAGEILQATYPHEHLPKNRQ